MPYGLAASVNSSYCTCQPGFGYNGAYSTCYCFAKSYIDPATSTCNPCSSLNSLYSQCLSCSTPYFSIALTGCIYTPNLPNGLATGGCQTGFIFHPYLGTCICNKNLHYAINSNGVCTLCAATDACYNCLLPFLSDGYVCLHSSYFPNFSVSLAKCNTGYTPKSNLITGQGISCACSAAAQYYQSGASCISCSTPPAGISAANCQSCSVASGFYLGSV